MKRFSLREISIALSLLFLASCNGSSSGGSFLGNLPGPNTPSGFSRMFDAITGTSKIYIIAPAFAPPLTPAGTFSHFSNVGQLAFNPFNGTLAGSSGPCGATVDIYNPPYSSSTTPTVSITGGATTLTCPVGVAWDGSGNLWVADFGTPGVKEFTPPFTATAAPAATNTFAAFPAALAINPVAGLMFVGDEGGVTKHLYVIPAPYTGVPTATFSFGSSTPKTAFVDQQGRLFVGFVSGALKGQVLVFVPPFATGNSPAFALTASPGGALDVRSLAIDTAQNVYAQLGDGSVVMFNGPVLGAISAPSALLGCPPAASPCIFGAGGLAFGP